MFIFVVFKETEDVHHVEVLETPKFIISITIKLIDLDCCVSTVTSTFVSCVPSPLQPYLSSISINGGLWSLLAKQWDFMM